MRYEGHPDTFLPVIWRGTLKRNALISSLHLCTYHMAGTEMSPTLRQGLLTESYATFEGKNQSWYRLFSPLPALGNPPGYCLATGAPKMHLINLPPGLILPS